MTSATWPTKVVCGEYTATLHDAYETATHLGARYKLSDHPTEPLRAFVVPLDFAEVFEAHHLAEMVVGAVERGW